MLTYTEDQVEVLDQIAEDLEAERINQEAEMEEVFSAYEHNLNLF